jgi:uncharacterized protein (TIGR02246 family)
MRHSFQSYCSKCFLFVAMCSLLTTASLASPNTSASIEDEKAIKDVLARFYAAWNAHDVTKMVSVYAADVDHINVYAEWSKGRPAITEALERAHSGRLRDDQKTYTVEKIRFVKPDVAVVHVRSLSAVFLVGNIGTYVMTKTDRNWLVVSFTNVEYKLSPAEGVK